MSRLLSLALLLAAPLAHADAVMLLDGGAQKINVIKVIREATNLGLKEAKDLVVGAPRLVKDGLPADEASALARKLTDAGAKVEVRRADGTVVKPGELTTPVPSPAGSWEVRLETYGANKILVIKLVRDATGLGLKETKTLVESAPAVLKQGLTGDEAEALVAKLKEAGAQARAVRQAK